MIRASAYADYPITVDIDGLVDDAEESLRALARHALQRAEYIKRNRDELAWSQLSLGGSIGGAALTIERTMEQLVTLMKVAEGNPET